MIILVPIPSPTKNQKAQGTGVPVLWAHMDGRPVSTQDTEPQRAGSAPTTTTEMNFRIRELRSQDNQGAWGPKKDRPRAPRGAGQDRLT